MAQLARTNRQTSSAFSRYRWKELGLLIIPFLVLLLGMAQLLIVSSNEDLRSAFDVKILPPLQGLIPILGLISVMVLANVVLSLFFRKADQVLLPLVGLQSGLGVLMATRLGPDLPEITYGPGGDPNFGSKQLLWVLLGVILCLATMFILRNVNWLARYKYTWIALTFLVLSPTTVKGIISFATGAPTRDVLELGPINLQPTEFLKITIITFFAAYLSETRDILAQGSFRLGWLRLPPLRQLGPLVLMLGIALIIFLIVRDLGLALLIYGLFLCLMYLASGRLYYTIASLGIFALMAVAGFVLLGYVRQRFTTVGIDVVNWSAASEAIYQEGGGAFQIVQGLIALSSGGIFGAGLGLGHPVGPGFVPAGETDMVLTALGEELGLAGLFAILGVYLLIVYRGFRIAIEATDPFRQLMAAGLTSIFAIQTLVIAAGNLKLMPLTGIPLPLLSYGGSSILANYIAIGILLRISYDSAVERSGSPNL